MLLRRTIRNARRAARTLFSSRGGGDGGGDALGHRKLQRVMTLLIICLVVSVALVQLTSFSMISLPGGITFNMVSKSKSWAVVVIACNRPWYLDPVLKQLLSLPKNQLATIPIYISQDGNHQGVMDIAMNYRFQTTHWQRPRLDSDDQQANTANLAKHYKWTLDRLFFKEGFSHAIILEDDLLVSADFLSYFEHTAPILDLDGRVMCISAFNDVGDSKFATNESRLFRTGFFPGLGWMLKKSLWEELSPMWPRDHFDWWLRSSQATRGRFCIAPEVSRTRHIGRIGVNCGKDQNGKPDENVQLNASAFIADGYYEGSDPVEYTPIEALLRPAYDRRLSDLISDATIIDPYDTKQQLKLINSSTNVNLSSPVYLTMFKNLSEYESLQKTIYLSHFSEQRSFYKGLLEVTLPHGNGRLLIANKRTCVFLPPSLRDYPASAIAPIVSDEGKSCDEACIAKNMKCDPARFPDVADALMMESYFPCERNAWVLDSSSTNPRYHRWPLNGDDDAGSSGAAEGTCFSNAPQSTCSVWQAGAMRLCPCSSL